MGEFVRAALGVCVVVAVIVITLCLCAIIVKSTIQQFKENK